jgi:hypothetical protein
MADGERSSPMSDTISQKRRLPIRPGRFVVPEEPGTEPYLMASRCRACDKYFVPPRVVCLNCFRLEEMEPAKLSGRGKLYSYTVVWQQLPNSLVKVPYAIVIVALNEGCQIHGVVTEDPESLEIGMDMEVYFEVAREDEEGNELLVDKFRPVAGQKKA